MNILKTRWAQLALFGLSNLFAGSLYSWSILSAALAVKLSEGGEAVSAADLGWIFGVASAVNPIAMIAGGWVNDRLGPRLSLCAGGLMIGAGLMLSSLAASPGMLALSYGVCFGLGVGLSYVSTIGASMKLFPDRRGLAGGIVTMAYGLSSMMIPPIAAGLIAKFGISGAMSTLGALCGGVIICCGLLSKKPEEGEAKPLDDARKKEAKSEGGADLDWKGMLGTLRFWLMLALFICGSIPAMMIISGAASLAQSEGGLSAAAAAAAVSAIAVANTCGRFASGIASDRFGRIPTLMLSLVAAGAGLWLLLAQTGSVVLFFAGICLAAWCYGSFVGIYPGFTIEEFGARHASVNYGIMAAGFSSAGIIGPMLLKLQAESSSLPFTAALCVSAFGLVLASAVRPLCGSMKKTP